MRVCATEQAQHTDVTHPRTAGELALFCVLALEQAQPPALAPVLHHQNIAVVAAGEEGREGVACNRAVSGGRLYGRCGKGGRGANPNDCKRAAM